MNNIQKNNPATFMKEFLNVSIEERLNKDVSQIDLTDDFFLEKIIISSKKKSPSTLLIISYFLKSFLDINSDESIRNLPQDLLQKALPFLYSNPKQMEAKYQNGKVNIYFGSERIFSLDFNKTKKDGKPSQIYNFFLNEYVLSLKKVIHFNKKFELLKK